MKLLHIIACTCMMLLYAVLALGAPRSFVVAPFQIVGPSGNEYLEKAIPSSLASRLHWKGQVEALAKGAPPKALSDGEEAKKALDASKAQYIIWGNATIVGEQCNLEVRVLGKDGKEWHKNFKSPLKALMGTVQGAGDNIGMEVFGRPAQAASSQQGPGVINQMNPDIVVNQTNNQQQVYLNPQFRYQGDTGGDASRLRSQTLPFTMVDFLVGNFSGKNKSEVAMLSEHRLHIYTWEQGRLKLQAETVVSMSAQNYSLHAIDLDHDGALELVVSAFFPDTAGQQSGNQPSSYIYSYAGGRLRLFCDRSPYFMSVVKMPPNFSPMLVGNAWDAVKVFAPGVREMVKSGNKYLPAGRLSLAKDANAFNFAWLPGGRSGEGDKLVVLADDERLKVFGPKGEELYKSTEKFSGSNVGIEHVKGVYGMGRDNLQLPDQYYAPMRMIPVDLNRNGEYVLLVNKPISVAAQFFDRYRFFPEGEVHALFWDGVGLAMKWKTRRIKGSVVNIDLGDIMNNGVQSLVVGVNTHPGALGVGQRQSFLLVYPLDTARMDPNTPWDRSEMEEQKE